MNQTSGSAVGRLSDWIRLCISGMLNASLLAGGRHGLGFHPRGSRSFMGSLSTRLRLCRRRRWYKYVDPSELPRSPCPERKSLLTETLQVVLVPSGLSAQGGLVAGITTPLFNNATTNAQDVYEQNIYQSFSVGAQMIQVAVSDKSICLPRL